MENIYIIKLKLKLIKIIFILFSDGFENDYRDNETKYIIKNLEKGVRIFIDEHGNLIFKKMCQLTVHVKDWLLTVDGNGSLSDDIIALHGMFKKKFFINFSKSIFVKIYIFLRFLSNKNTQVNFHITSQSKYLILKDLQII